jgi:CRP-like cAMP-binding protein
MEKLITFLEASNFISRSKAEELAAQFFYKAIPKTGFHLREREISNEYFFLEQGYMRAFAYSINGNEVTTNFYTAGQVVLEGASFYNRTTSKETIQALTDCSGWYLTYEQLNNLFQTMPEFCAFGQAVLVKGFATLKERTLSMITETADERYARLLRTTPQIFQMAPLKYIASYLGTTDTTLARIRKESQVK